MRRKKIILGVVVVALALTAALLPSGAGQHYSAILSNGTTATGHIISDGPLSKTASASVPALPYAQVSFSEGREIGLSLDPPTGLFSSEFAYGCIRIVTQRGEDKGCSRVAMHIPYGNVFGPGFATVHFSVPSWPFPGTRLTAILTVVARGLPAIVPTVDLVFEPDQSDFFIGPTLSFVWPAVASGRVGSGHFGRFFMPAGNAKLYQGIGAEVENCDGLCIEPPPCTDC